MALIENTDDIIRDIGVYEAMFPDSYTSYESIKQALDGLEDEKNSVFGIQVSSEWPDRCYGFEIKKEILRVPIFRYIGLFKC